MVCSMTGFGRGEAVEGSRRITVEMKSVNNRFLDLSMKMPRMLNPYEAKIRTEVGRFIRRGKVDLFISYVNLEDPGEEVCYHPSLAAEYLQHLGEMKEAFGLSGEVSLSLLAGLPDVFMLEDSESDDTDLWPLLAQALDEAGNAILEARKKEGEFLRDDLLRKLDAMTEEVDFITRRAPDIVTAYRARLTGKIQDLLGDTSVDEARIAQEVTMYADKICVDEELVRLRSHICTARELLGTADGDGVGRRLDFLAQEMNREANTILSKTDDAEISNAGILLKTNIEKVREQIQNLE